MLETREITLLRACKQLLEKQKQSPFVLNLLSEKIEYDETTCDGYCLLDDIDALLAIQKSTHTKQSINPNN